MGRELTDAQRNALAWLDAETPVRFTGLRPGSNFTALVEYVTAGGSVPGEMVDDLHRLGLLSAEPNERPEPIPGTPPEGYPVPDTDYCYRITPAGRAALAQHGGREPDGSDRP